MDHKRSGFEPALDTEITRQKDGPLKVAIDFEKYLPYLESEDISDENKREFLQTLSNILTDIISLGFNVHPLQNLEDGCGQIEKSAPEPLHVLLDRVDSSDSSLIQTFASTAESGTDSANKGGAL